MKAIFRLMPSIVFISLLPLTVHAGAPQAHEDQNLQAIVDFDQTLSMATPSDIATQNLQDALRSQDVTYQQAADDQEKPFQDPSVPAKHFQDAVSDYIKDVYNHRDYARAISQDGSHIIQFLNISNDLNLGADVVYVCIRLFYNKYKAAEVIDDTVNINLLEQMPSLIKRHFSDSETARSIELAGIKKRLQTVLVTKLTSHLAVPTIQQADQLAPQISQELLSVFDQEVEAVKQAMQTNENTQRLRTMIIRFFDYTINKVMWDTQHPETILQSFNTIATRIQHLGAHNIINHMDDMDDLLWTLVQRFAYFLDLTGASLPLEFYEGLEQTLENKTMFFLEYREQDEGITTKKECLIDALIQAKTKAFAFQRSGLIPAHMG